jgi:hypothetical protein
MVTSCGMHTLYGMFVNKPNPTNLSAELNAQIITVSILDRHDHKLINHDCNMNEFFSFNPLWFIYQNVRNSKELWNDTQDIAHFKSGL